MPPHRVAAFFLKDRRNGIAAKNAAEQKRQEQTEC